MVYEYGWIISTSGLMSADFVDDAVAELAESGFSPEFIQLARTAGERGCWFLRFDADADLELDLPIGGYGLDPDELPYPRLDKQTNEGPPFSRFSTCGSLRSGEPSVDTASGRLGFLRECGLPAKANGQRTVPDGNR